MPRLVSVARAALLLVAAVLSVTVVSRSPVPLPDLVLPVVVAAALLAGPSRGALLGLAGGWLVDLLPPGSPLLGTAALLYAAAGLLAGAGRREGQQPFGWVAVVGAASALVVTGGRVVVALLSAAPVDLRVVGLGWLLTATWCALVVPVLVGLEQRLEARSAG